MFILNNINSNKEEDPFYPYPLLISISVFSQVVFSSVDVHVDTLSYFDSWGVWN